MDSASRFLTRRCGAFLLHRVLRDESCFCVEAWRSHTGPQRRGGGEPEKEVLSSFLLLTLLPAPHSDDALRPRGTSDRGTLEMGQGAACRRPGSGDPLGPWGAPWSGSGRRAGVCLSPIHCLPLPP